MQKYQLHETVYSSNIPKQQAFTTFKQFKVGRPKAGRSLRGSHQLLARYIINFFIENWNKRSFEDRKKGFYLDTNNRSLARLCDCTERTIRNQVIRLIETDILLASEMTGRGIRVWLNPQAILNFKVADLKKDQVLVLEPDPVKNKSTDVDKKDIRIKQDRRSRNLSKNIEEHHPSRTGTGLESGHGPGMGSVLDFANEFWSFARSRIYWDRSFSDRREKRLLDLVKDLLDRRIEESGKAPFDVYFKQMGYLNYARQWFEKHPEVDPPDPYHFFSESENGFRFCQIEKWDRKKHFNYLMRKRRVGMKLEAERHSKGETGVNLTNLIDAHAQQIRNSNSARMDQWFVTEYPKHYFR